MVVSILSISAVNNSFDLFKCRQTLLTRHRYCSHTGTLFTTLKHYSQDTDTVNKTKTLFIYKYRNCLQDIDTVHIQAQTQSTRHRYCSHTDTDTVYKNPRSSLGSKPSLTQMQIFQCEFSFNFTCLSSSSKKGENLQIWLPRQH